jgi:predicted ATP-dependent Lon-type protease
MGYEPSAREPRLKLLLLVRLVPLVERNFNLVELGPRGTGKSYLIQEISPCSALLTGSPTVAGLFGHMTGRQKDLLQTSVGSRVDQSAGPTPRRRRQRMTPGQGALSPPWSN